MEEPCKINFVHPISSFDIMNPNAVWVCEIETKRAREWSTQRENLEADTHDSQLLLQDPKLHVSLLWFPSSQMELGNLLLGFIRFFLEMSGHGLKVGKRDKHFENGPHLPILVHLEKT